MEYRINFSSRTSTDGLVALLGERFGLSSSEVHVGGTAEPGVAPVVSVSPGGAGERYGCRLRAGTLLADRVGHLDPVELAAILCVGLQSHAVIAGGRTGWRLVTEDGHVAEVIVDDELIGDEGIVIVAALASIPTMPHIPVRTYDWCAQRLPADG